MADATDSARPKLLVPDELRRRFVRLLVKVDFFVSLERRTEFKKEIRSFSPDAGSLGVSSKDDVEVAFSIHRLGVRATSSTYHAIIEFRRDRISPYPLVGQRRLRRLLETVERCASRIHLEHWKQVAEVPRKSFSEQASSFQRLVETSFAFCGRPAKLSGFDIDFEKTESKPAAGASLAWSGDRVVVTTWTLGHRLSSVAEAFVVGPQLLSDILLDAPSAETKGPHTGTTALGDLPRGTDG